MNTRKIKLLGVLVALLVVAGIGSAALVDYISNTVYNDVEVTSPLEITEFEIGDLSAGNETCLNLSVANHANRNICGYFTVTVKKDGNPFDCKGVDIEGAMTSCECVEDCCLEAECYEGVYVFEQCLCFTAGETEEFDAKIYSHPGLEPGNYTFDTVIRPCENERWNDGTPCECGEDENLNCGGCCEEGCLCDEGPMPSPTP